MMTQYRLPNNLLSIIGITQLFWVATWSGVAAAGNHGARNPGAREHSQGVLAISVHPYTYVSSIPAGKSAMVNL